MLDTKTVSSRAFCCGKTFRVYYPQKTTHSDTFWLDWFKSVSHCNQQGLNGQTLVMCIRPELSRGESSMLNTSGLAQRRKRVFLVASARERSVAQILFERKSLQGYSQS